MTSVNKKPWPQINLSEILVAIVASKGYSSAAPPPPGPVLDAEPANAVTVGRQQHHLSSVTFMAGITPTVLSVLEGRSP